MTDTADEFLAHFGVKGMKWGVRHVVGPSGRVSGAKQPESTPVLTKHFSTGDSVSIYKDPQVGIPKFVEKHFPNSNFAAQNRKFAAFTLKDKDGKKVGDASFVRTTSDELYLDWVGIKPAHRGKGYASAALQGVVKYAQSEGIKKLTLEVPGNAPDARHIYEKLGFRDDKEAIAKNKDDYDPNDTWGGLTPMALHVNQVKHAEDTTVVWEQTFAQEFADMLTEYFNSIEGDDVSDNTLEQADSADDFLAHFGVKGMKWGVRHDPNRAANRQSARIAKASDRAAKVRQKEKARQEQAKAETQRAKNHDATVLKARKNLPKSARDLRVAKADYRVNKQTMGRAAAKEILNKHKQTYRLNKRNASLLTGKEQVAAQAEYHKQLQYREMMRQELARQRRREETAKLLQDLLNPPRVTQPRYDYGPYGPPKPATPRDGGHYTATPHRG